MKSPKSWTVEGTSMIVNDKKKRKEEEDRMTVMPTPLPNPNAYYPALPPWAKKTLSDGAFYALTPLDALC